MYQTGYNATGYYVTGYYLPASGSVNKEADAAMLATGSMTAGAFSKQLAQADVFANAYLTDFEIKEPGTDRVTYGGSIPAKLPSDRQSIFQSDMEIVSLVMASIEAGIIK
jgi:hypothetical protein